MTTTSAAADEQLRYQLKEVEEELRDLRTRRGAKVKARDAARDAFLRLPASKREDADSDEFRAVTKAVDEVRDLDERIENAQRSQVGLLKMLGQDTSRLESQDGERGSREVVKRLTSEPGAWLAAVLDRRKATLSALPEDIRTKSLTAGANVGTVEEAAALFDLLAPYSAAFNSGIPRMEIGATQTRVPVFSTLPTAAWTAELGTLPTSDPGVAPADVKPEKAGLVTELSIEAFQDLSPAALAMVQEQLLRAVAVTLDTGVFFGSGTSPQPRGLANTSGIQTASGTTAGMQGFLAGLAKLLVAHARPGAVVVTGANLTSLLALVEQTGSNVPLLDYDVSGGEPTLRLPRIGLPTFVNNGGTANHAIMFDPRAALLVIRRVPEIAVDPYYDLNTAKVGLRAIIRATVLVGSPAGVVDITLS